MFAKLMGRQTENTLNSCENIHQPNGIRHLILATIYFTCSANRRTGRKKRDSVRREVSRVISKVPPPDIINVSSILLKQSDIQ